MDQSSRFPDMEGFHAPSRGSAPKPESSQEFVLKNMKLLPKKHIWPPGGICDGLVSKIVLFSSRKPDSPTTTTQLLSPCDKPPQHSNCEAGHHGANNHFDMLMGREVQRRTVHY
ncbi:hypothetical protein FKM82_016963 [Ascaphus truei]